MEIFDMLTEGLNSMFGYMSVFQVAGITIFGIAFFNWFAYSVFRFVISPLLGDGTSWSAVITYGAQTNTKAELRNAKNKEKL